MSPKLYCLSVGLLLVIQTCLAAGNPCGSDSWNYDASSGNCYQVVGTEYTWQQARQGCISRGGDLTSILSSREHNFIVDLAIAVGTPGRGIWIGLSDTRVEGQFVWSDGSQASYTNWLSAQPDNYGNREDCGELWKQNNYLWNDAPCSWRAPSICKKRGLTPDSTLCPNCKITGGIVTFTRNVFQARGGYEGCKQACANNFWCIGWSHKNTGTCELNIFNVVSARDFESGPYNQLPSCDPYTKACLPSPKVENKKLQLAFVSRTPTASGDECAVSCSSLNETTPGGCVRWFWNTPSKFCFLFRENYVSAPGWNSGTKPCA